MSATSSSSIQPRNGDTVMVCKHLVIDSAVPFEGREVTVPADAHFFKTPVANFFVAVCQQCHESSASAKELVQIAKYIVTWKEEKCPQP